MPGEGNFTNERSSFCSDAEDQRGGVCVCRDSWKAFQSSQGARQEAQWLSCHEEKHVVF